MVGQEGKMKIMAGVSLAEQVLRDLGPLELPSRVAAVVDKVSIQSAP